MLPRPPDFIDTDSIMLSGSGAFVHASTASVNDMISPERVMVQKVGVAIESGSLGQLRKAFGQARDAGFDPNGFCYQDRNGMWFTSLLAILARNTKGHLALAQAIFKEGPEKGWDAYAQQCWVMCPTYRGEEPVLLDFEQAVPALLALRASQPSSNSKAQIEEVVLKTRDHLARWGMDWGRPSRDGHTALMELVRRAPLGMAKACHDIWLGQEVNPLVRNDEGMSALDYLEERLEVPPKSDPSHAAAGSALLATWREMEMEKALPPPVDPQEASGSPKPFRL